MAARDIVSNNVRNRIDPNCASYELDEAIKNLTGLNGGSINQNPAVSDMLRLAHSDSVKQYSGPSLISGSVIGKDSSGATITTASGENALTIVAADSGVKGQIAGFTIGVKDANGNAKKTAQVVLDAFEESIRGKNASEDNGVNIHVGAKANMTVNVGLTDKTESHLLRLSVFYVWKRRLNQIH